MKSLSEIANGFKTWGVKLKYLGERNLLYEVRMKGTTKDTGKAVKKFGEDKVIPELSTYLERRIGEFEKNYNADVMEKENWRREPKKDSKGNDNPNYAKKDIQAKYYGERADMQKTGQLLFENLYGILIQESYKNYSKAKKYNQDVIKKLPLRP